MVRCAVRVCRRTLFVQVLHDEYVSVVKALLVRSGLCDHLIYSALVWTRHFVNAASATSLCLFRTLLASDCGSLPLLAHFSFRAFRRT